jgi:hypothetical protein
MTWDSSMRCLTLDPGLHIHSDCDHINHTISAIQWSTCPLCEQIISSCTYALSSPSSSSHQNIRTSYVSQDNYPGTGASKNVNIIKEIIFFCFFLLLTVSKLTYLQSDWGFKSWEQPQWFHEQCLLCVPYFPFSSSCVGIPVEPHHVSEREAL